MLLFLATALFSLFSGLNAQVDANGITLYEKLEEMERQILDPTTLIFDVLPCGDNKFGDPSAGEQTSAEWVRIVFHDMITKNVAGPGLGGLDASIGFETERPENVGIFVNVTIGQLGLFSSVFLSMADLINVGLADALASCDPNVQRLPLYVGRIDATEAGPAGVPQPTDSFDVAKAAFANAGFSQSEMIQAVACGHSLGGVHQSNFPTITVSSIPPVGTDGRMTFDTTPDSFDFNNVHEYLTGTGNKGGPLVIGPDATNSDFRIFNSDGNSTINAMNTPASFESTCFSIFEKMITTVPDSVTLSGPIVPRPWIMRASHLDLNANGQVTFSGRISGHSMNTMPDIATYNYNTAAGSTGITFTSKSGTLLQPTGIGYGNIVDYLFTDVLQSSYNSITVENSYNAPINQNIFILPSQSFNNLIRNSLGFPVNNQYIIRAAILTTLKPSTPPTVKLWYPVSQQFSVAPKIVSTTAPMSVKSTIGSYTIYQAVISIGDGVNPVSQGASWFQVTTATQASAKVNPADLDATWPACGVTPVTNC